MVCGICFFALFGEDDSIAVKLMPIWFMSFLRGVAALISLKCHGVFNRENGLEFTLYVYRRGYCRGCV